MKLIRFIFVSLLLFGKQVAAQHCPYDYSNIIVLNIRADSASGIIPGLKITFLDSADIPVMGYKFIGGKWTADTLKFWQNAAKTTMNHYVDNENPLEPEKIRYWFANDNYVLVVGNEYHNQKCKIRIEDIDGEKNGGSFRTTIVPVSSADIYPLCTEFSLWDLGEGYGFVKGYAPKKIFLLKQ
ncbi:MAG TPA: hypothetical protein VFJ43_13295 [Bacteroidia bacterium]|nr:hypothetical protein [Bacteroidia bacterium]